MFCVTTLPRQADVASGTGTCSHAKIYDKRIPPHASKAAFLVRYVLPFYFGFSSPRDSFRGESLSSDKANIAVELPAELIVSKYVSYTAGNIDTFEIFQIYRTLSLFVAIVNARCRVILVCCCTPFSKLVAQHLHMV